VAAAWPEIEMTAAFMAMQPEMTVNNTSPFSYIECYQTDDELAFHIAPGANQVVWLQQWIFVAFWLLFAVGLTRGWLASEARDGLFILVLGVIWAAGLALLYFRLPGQFGETYVLVSHDRLVLKWNLCGIGRRRHYALNADSAAELVEVYSDEGDRTTYVRISTAARPVKFGTFLVEEKQKWIVGRINSHLGKGRKKRSG
jgi:hypothetical protein